MRTTGSTSTARTSRSRWRSRSRVVVLAGALVLAALPAGTAAARGGSTHTVNPGESIQAAVDRAASGDTIRLGAGTFTEAVCIDHKALKIVGAGMGRTTITWPDWGQAAPLPEVATNPCWEAHERSDAEGNPRTLADDVSGLFFLYPDGPVTVSSLSTRNHPANGIVAWGANGFDVHATSGTGHERYGISAAASTNIRIAANVEKGVDRGAPWYAGTGGIGIGDSNGANARITANWVQGYNLGIFIRESRGGRITGNTVTGNCVGVLMFDDAATEVPDATGNVQGGDFRITANAAVANNRYCLAGRDGSQVVSGVGMSVTNADHVTIRANTVTGNRANVPAGAAPVNYPGGGLSLVTFAPPPGTLPEGVPGPGPVEHVEVTANHFADNAPVDIFVTPGEPANPFLGPAGPGIVIRHNLCSTSNPGGLC